METRPIKKSIDVNTSKEKVWEVLLKDKFTRVWYAVFSEGSHAETDWETGSKAIFTDNSKRGIVGKIVDNKPNETLVIEYEGIIKNGIEDYDSEMANDIKGSRETYHLSENNGLTYLSVSCDMPEDYFESMSQAWDKAILKIKELAESI